MPYSGGWHIPATFFADRTISYYGACLILRMFEICTGCLVRAYRYHLDCGTCIGVHIMTLINLEWCTSPAVSHITAVYLLSTVALELALCQTDQYSLCFSNMHGFTVFWICHGFFQHLQSGAIMTCLVVFSLYGYLIIWIRTVFTSAFLVRPCIATQCTISLLISVFGDTKLFPVPLSDLQWWKQQKVCFIVTMSTPSSHSDFLFVAAPWIPLVGVYVPFGWSIPLSEYLL